MGTSYENVEYLDDQPSVGSILTFDFAQDVKKVWVRFQLADPYATDTARVRVDGGDPDSDTGTLIDNYTTWPFAKETNVVKVLAPNGALVSVHGYW